MTWSDFYLLCFAAGFFFSLVSVVAGQLDLNFGGHGDGGDALQLHAGSDAATGHHGASHFNMGTVAAFFAWFGGTGYLMTTYTALWFAATLGIALAAGLAGATAVFWFLSRVLMREREELDPADYELVGVLGTVSSTIRPDGIGEILFSQQGLHRAVPARSESGKTVARGTEVVITRYDEGVAWVRPWEEFEQQAAAGLH